MIDKKRLWTKVLFSQILLLGLSCSPLKQHTGQTAVNDFTELPDPTADTLSDWSRAAKGLQASFVSIDKRFSKSVFPEIATRTTTRVEGWKGEKLSAQLLLWTTENVEDVHIDFADFRSSTGAHLSKGIAQSRFVRYVMTDEFGKGCGKRKAEDYASFLSADILDNLSHFDLEEKKVRPVWITVEIPRSAATGNYRSQLTVSGKGITPQHLEIELEVIGQVLPPPSEWIFHLDQWQHPSAIARVEQVPVWSDQHFEAMKSTMQMLADAGQKVITATLNKDPWNVQTFDPYADMIVWTKRQDGSWVYDYTVFDRWVQFMMDIGVTKMINCYSMIPWNNEIHYKDEATDQVINIKAVPGTAVFEEVWEPFLKDFVKHLEQKDWLKITNIAIDERKREEVDGALKLIQRVAPELGVSYADNQKTYQRYPNSQDISISVGHPFSSEDLSDRRSRGLNTTFYICCADEFPNQFTFSDPAESTYLAWYAMAANFNGFLRWAFNSWVENPLRDSRFRTWPAGDTYVVYPQGRSSIRFERMVEGIQDYEKICIIKAALAQKNDIQGLESLNAAIQKLNNVQRREGWNEELNSAKSLLNELSRTVTK